MKLCLYGKKSNKRWTTDMMKHAKEITMRHEEKYLCSESYLRILESRLQGFLSPDSNQDELGYEIRSLYFDTATERLYEEGLAGLEHRNKYRMRIYNGDSDVIKLEKKTSIRNLKKKDTHKSPTSTQEQDKCICEHSVMIKQWTELLSSSWNRAIKKKGPTETVSRSFYGLLWLELCLWSLGRLSGK